MFISLFRTCLFRRHNIRVLFDQVMSFNVGSDDLAAFVERFEKFQKAVGNWISSEEEHMRRFVELTSSDEMVSVIGVCGFGFDPCFDCSALINKR